MKLTWRFVIGLAAAAVLIFILLILMKAIRSDARAEALEDAHKQERATWSQQSQQNAEQAKQLQESLRDIVATIVEIKKDEAGRLAREDARWAKITTPEQVGEEIQKQLGLQHPVVVAPEDAGKLKEAAQACVECGIKLESANRQLAEVVKGKDNFEHQVSNLQDTVRLRDLTIKSLNEDVTTWRNTAKGGSKFKRILKATGVVGCAALGAYAGSKASPAGAGIGGGAGAGICQVIF